MEKFITDERTGLQYELVGDYYLIAAYRHLWTTTPAVYSQAQSWFVCRAADYRQAERLPCRHKRASRGNVISAGKTTCRKGGRNGSA